VQLTQSDKEKLKKADLDQFNNFALMPTVFEKDDEISVEKISDALKKAIEIYRELRRAINDSAIDQNGNWMSEVEVNDVSEWMKTVIALQSQKNEQWVFRGQSNEKWSLETSLGRAVEYSEGTGLGIATHEQLKRAEYNAMTEFLREASRDIQYRFLKGINLLSLMQHHGSKTRLLDFTYSPLSALFFSMDEAKSNSFAIWAIRLNSFCKNGEDLGGRIENDLAEAEKLLMADTDLDVSKGVLIIRPEITNARLSAQSGLFLMPKHLGVSFESNLKSVMPANSAKRLSLNDSEKLANASVLKFIFPERTIEDVFKVLKAMQITPRSIFPDINGLARSVTWDITDEFKK
jgi:hypothetical protein